MDKQRSPARNVGVAALIVVAYVALAWLGNASNVAVDYFDYSWAEPVPYGSLLGDMASVPISEVLANFNSFLLLPFLNPLMLLTAIVAVWATLRPSDISRRALGIAAVTTVPFGVLGLLASVPFTFDTEYFSEGWSTLLAFALWSIILCVYTARWYMRTTDIAALNDSVDDLPLRQERTATSG